MNVGCNLLIIRIMKKTVMLYVWMIVGNFLFPLGGVLLPYFYWKLNRRTEDVAFTKEACNLLNFQVLFSFIMVGVFLFGWYRAVEYWSVGEVIDWGYMKWALVIWLLVNFIYPLFIIFITLAKGKSFRAWPPSIPFFRA